VDLRRLEGVDFLDVDLNVLDHALAVQVLRQLLHLMPLCQHPRTVHPKDVDERARIILNPKPSGVRDQISEI